jgi:transcriptional regulator with XRE-family HTH domain
MLRIARTAAGLTQKQLATAAGIEAASICQLEAGTRSLATVGYGTLVRMARALHLTAEDLCPVPDTRTA